MHMMRGYEAYNVTLYACKKIGSEKYTKSAVIRPLLVDPKIRSSRSVGSRPSIEKNSVP